MQGNGIKTKSRPLTVIAHLRSGIIKVKTEMNSLAPALYIAIAKLTNDPDYKAYRQGRKIYPKVIQLLEMTFISLDNGGEIPEIERFQDHFGNIRSLCIWGKL